MLTNVFNIMVGKVEQREESLKREVAQLRIVIDEQKALEEVEKIVDTEFFQDLKSQAQQLRDENKQADEQDKKD